MDSTGQKRDKTAKGDNDDRRASVTTRTRQGSTTVYTTVRPGEPSPETNGPSNDSGRVLDTKTTIAERRGDHRVACSSSRDREEILREKKTLAGRREASGRKGNIKNAPSKQKYKRPNREQTEGPGAQYEFDSEVFADDSDPEDALDFSVEKKDIDETETTLSLDGRPRSFSTNSNDIEAQVSSEPVVAQLVDEKMEQQRFEEERERIRKETISNMRENVPEAEVYDDTADKQKRRMVTTVLILVAFASVAAAVILGVVLGTKDRSGSSLSRKEELENILNVIYGDVGVDDPETAQYEAFNWMASNDTSFSLRLESEDEAAVFRQRWAMCVLAFATDVDSWENSARWLNTSLSECAWSGVTCDDRGRLVGVNLALNGLNGTIPTDMGKLMDLKYLFLHGNPLLRGSIPSEMGEVSTLVSFYANDNALEGSLPTELGNLANLEKLNLSRNRFTGPVPLRFGFIHELVDMDLSENLLTGSVPFTFWRLQRLESLRLNDNLLEGEIPSDIGHMVELSDLELQNNRLTGTLPLQFEGLINLETILAFGNDLECSVSDEICKLEVNGVLGAFEMDCLSEVICSCCTACK